MLMTREAPAAAPAVGSRTGNSPRLALPLPQQNGHGQVRVPMATLTAAVSQTRIRRPQSIRFVPAMRTMTSFFDETFLDMDYDEAVESERDEEDEKTGMPLPLTEIEVWARYGFVDERFVRRRRTGGPTERSSTDGTSGLADRPAQLHRPRRRSDPTVGRRRRGEDASRRRDLPDPYSNSNDVGDSRASRTGANILGRGQRQPQQHAGGASPASPNVGTSTPTTVILTPPNNGSSKNIVDASANTTADTIQSGFRRDSLAASFAAVSASQRSSRGNVGGEGSISASAPGMQRELEAKEQQNGEAKREERDTGSVEGNLGSDTATRRGENDHLNSTEWQQHGNNTNTGTSGVRSANSSTSSMGNGGGQVRPASRNRRPQRTMAEVERHKRNRAERLRAYGCSRTLYPRIQPEPFSGASDILEEVETKQWVDTLRVSASLRGESLMGVHTVSNAQHQTTAHLGEQQAEARASRVANVSKMEGPDGLLHCAVLKGDHPLAARAAQFLVDKLGANVNSRDEWGRTPLHTASGKGIVSMARFFVRRGANVDARDNDERTPLYFACAGGHTTMARYLTRVEVGARVNLRDSLGLLAGEYFWDTVGLETQEDIVAVLSAVGWPDPPQPNEASRGRRSKRGAGGGKNVKMCWRSQSEHPPRSAEIGGGGGEAGMKRLATEMRLLMRRR